MAQVQHRARASLDGAREPLPGPFPTLIEWHVRQVAGTRDSALGWPAQDGGQMTAVLDAWRSAERSLAMHLESGPERDRLRFQVACLRAKYHCLFEATPDASTDCALRPTD
jgi:hypothetical protein